MSVIQRIRDKGAWIIFGIIALALIAFILQDGIRRGGSTFSNTTVIGKVNGEKIMRADFDEKLQMQEKIYGPQGAQREQLINSVWNQDVEEIVLGQEYGKLGLQVSPKELTDILFGPNSPLKQEFTDPKTGVFMADNARQAFAQLKKSKNADQIKTINSVYIDPTIAQTLRSKYQSLVVGAAYIPKWMLEKQSADNNAIASFSYVYMPYSAVNDSASRISDDEIAAYVKKHAKEYTKTEETRSIAYVSFNAAPSAADSAAVLGQLLAQKAEFAAATDINAFLTKAGTATQYYNSYFSKAKMQMPAKDSLVRTPVGSIYGPYLDGSNYVLAKMVGTKTWPDSARVRHILVATADPRSGQQVRPDSVAKKLIDSIETAIRGGASFEAMVTKYSDDPGSKDKGGLYEFFPQGQMMIPFNDFAFDKPVGTKGVVKTDFGYHYMEVLGQKNAAPVYKIAYLSKPIEASSETVTAANTAAAQFAVSGKDAKQFNANASKQNLPVMNAANIKENDFNIQGFQGTNRQLIKWIYSNKVGDVSDPVEVGDHYVVARITAIEKEGLMSPAEARITVELILRNEKKAKQLIDTKFKGNTLEAYAASTGTPIQRADSLSFAAPFITGIGSEPKIVGAAFNKNLVGKVSEPIAGTTGVFAMKVENISAKPATADPATVKQGMLQNTKMNAYRGLDAVRKSATIKDYRSKFF